MKRSISIVMPVVVSSKMPNRARKLVNENGGINISGEYGNLKSLEEDFILFETLDNHNNNDLI
jgi:hypothetical protein